MAKDTKERILMTALDMFSKKGYEGTNIRELAASLGLVKSSIYKHYESKEAIWNALLDRMIAYYREHFGSAEHLPPVPDSLEDFISMTMRMVNLTIHDEQIVRTRKVLTLEQFRSPEMGRLYQQYLVSGPVGYMADLFAAQNMPRPKELAVRFYAQMFLLYSVYDGTGNKKAALALMDDLLDRTAEQLAAEKKRGKKNGK